MTAQGENGVGSGLWRRASALALALLSLASVASAQKLDPCVDVALVLAVDGSDSIDAREYRLQQYAIVRSFRDPQVLATLKSAGTVSVAVIFWGDAAKPVHHTEAVTIRDARDADRFARRVEGLPRRTGGNTGLGSGLAAALDRLATMGCAHRSIINVSGDGKENEIRRADGPRQETRTSQGSRAIHECHHQCTCNLQRGTWTLPATTRERSSPAQALS